jgi:hypothetical protein
VHDLLQDRAPWYVIGPLLGLVVVAVTALMNERMGVLGGFSAVVERVDGRAKRLPWKAWFLIGVVLGGLCSECSAGAGRPAAATAG